MRCFSKVADALCKGILVGGQSVGAESVEPTDNDDVTCRLKGGVKEARGLVERGHEGNGKCKGYGYPVLWMCLHSRVVPMQASEVRVPEGALRQVWRTRTCARALRGDQRKS